MSAPSKTPAPELGHDDDAKPVVPLRRNWDFQALWISQFTGTAGNEAANVAYPLLILATSGSAAYAGAVGAAQLLASGMASIPGGVLADRMDRKTLLIGCDLIRLALLGVFGYLLLSGKPSVFLVFGTAVASAACFGLSIPPALAAIKPLVPPSQLTRATEQNQIRPFAATTVGSPIGSALYAVSRAMPFFGTAITFALSAITLAFIRKPMQVPAPKRGKEHDAGLAAGFKFIFRQPILLLWMIWVIGSNMAFNHVGAFLAVIATAKGRGASDALIGLTLAVAGLGGVAGSLIARPLLKRLRPSTVFIAAAWLGPAAAILLAISPGVLTLGIILGCVFMRAPITNGLFFSYVATLVPDQLQGRVLGAVTFMSFFAQPIGILGIGLIFDHFGPLWVFTTMGIVSALAALPTLSKTIRKLPTPQEVAP